MYLHICIELHNFDLFQFKLVPRLLKWSEDLEEDNFWLGQFSGFSGLHFEYTITFKIK